MGFNNAYVQKNNRRRYFLPRINIKDYNVLIDGEVKMYNEIRRIALGKGDDYTDGCLLDYQYFKDHYKLVACDLSKQAILDLDTRAIQQIEFVYRLDNNVNAQILTIVEKEKKTV